MKNWETFIEAAASDSGKRWDGWAQGPSAYRHASGGFALRRLGAIMKITIILESIMLDREGFRPNVGIVLLNQRNQVFWGKRLRTHSWQFPQGGIKYGETPEQAMYRELHEEVGLASL
jgi:hypothetical protein